MSQDLDVYVPGQIRRYLQLIFLVLTAPAAAAVTTTTTTTTTTANLSIRTNL